MPYCRLPRGMEHPEHRRAPGLPRAGQHQADLPPRPLVPADSALVDQSVFSFITHSLVRWPPWWEPLAGPVSAGHVSTLGLAQGGPVGTGRPGGIESLQGTTLPSLGPHPALSHKPAVS